jgi:PAS domain S-box-containing protein
MTYTPYIWLNLVATLVPVGLILYIRNFRELPAARAFILLMSLVAAWVPFHILSISTTLLPLRIFWTRVQILPFAFIPLAFLNLALDYTGHTAWLTRPRLGWLLSVPILTILLDWTGAYHTLYRYDYALDFSGVAPVLVASQGVWYRLNLGYTYLLILAACAVLLTAFPVWTPHFFNAFVIAMGGALPFFVALFYAFGLTPIPGYNLAPATFILTGSLHLWAIVQKRLFDLIPIAREALLEQMPDGVIVVDDQARIVDLNPAAAHILGATRPHLVGQPFAPATRVPRLSQLAQTPFSPTTKRHIEWEAGPHWYQVSSSPVTTRQQHAAGHLIILRDITALKHTQARFVEQQRALAMAEERGRLARELHDGLGQTLGYVKMRAQLACELLAAGELAQAEAYLSNLVSVAQDAHTDIREYLLGVKATSPTERVFLSALQQYLWQFSRNYGIRTELHAPPVLDQQALSPTAELQLLRIVQEALTNIRKYAQASRVHVTLLVDETVVTLSVQDDGQGFDPAQPNDHGPTFGLRFMRERAEELHGALEVHSAPGQGTRVSVQIPRTTWRLHDPHIVSR